MLLWESPCSVEICSVKTSSDWAYVGVVNRTKTKVSSTVFMLINIMFDRLNLLLNRVQ